MGDGDDTTTDRHAHLRIDYVEATVKDHAACLGDLRTTLTALDKASSTNHATTQAQNDAILARLNQPSVVMAIIGDPAKVAGVVALLGALMSGAVALGYAQAPVRPVLVPVPIEAASTPSVQP